LPEDVACIADALLTDISETTDASEPDAQLMLSEATWNVYADFSALAPFGIGNPKPVFLFTGVQVSGVKRFGKDRNHVEVLFSHGAASVRAFQFFATEDDFTVSPKIGMTVRVLATLERDAFRGATRVALRIVDILAGE
jgi:single-stranded-DNA-specific exonuclease